MSLKQINISILAKREAKENNSVELKNKKIKREKREKYLSHITGFSPDLSQK